MVHHSYSRHTTEGLILTHQTALPPRVVQSMAHHSYSGHTMEGFILAPFAHQTLPPLREVQSMAPRGRVNPGISCTSNIPQGGSKYGAPWEGVIQELKISRRASRAASYCQEEANARWWQCIKSTNRVICVIDIKIFLLVTMY